MTETDTSQSWWISCRKMTASRVCERREGRLGVSERRVARTPSGLTAEPAGSRIQPTDAGHRIDGRPAFSHCRKEVPYGEGPPLPGVGLEYEGELWADTEEALVRQAAERAQTTHNMRDLPPEVVTKVRAAIRDE
jgi:predicted small metal-binding protein